MKLIGLSGYARAGKDTAAEALLTLGYKRVAFADKLREVLYALNPIVVYGPDTVRVKDVIDKFGWDGYKATAYSTEIRELLQRLGTEAGRRTLWDSIWVDAAFANLDENGLYVFTDVRFPNEANAIRERGGEILRITRPGLKPANDHPSETSLDDYNFDDIIFNIGTVDEFKRDVVNYVGWHDDWKERVFASRS